MPALRDIARDPALSDLRLEGVRIAFQTLSHRFLPLLLVFQVVVAVVAIAIFAKFTIGKAVAIQLQALGFRTVTGFPLSGQVLCRQGREAAVAADRDRLCHRTVLMLLLLMLLLCETGQHFFR